MHTQSHIHTEGNGVTAGWAQAGMEDEEGKNARKEAEQHTKTMREERRDKNGTPSSPSS